MRRTLALLGIAAAAVLGGCGSNGVTGTDQNGHATITQPATQARNAVNQQNQQLQQMEQRTNQDDPTQP